MSVLWETEAVRTFALTCSEPLSATALKDSSLMEMDVPAVVCIRSLLTDIVFSIATYSDVVCRY